ncbi:LruC domain-containing protein [Bacteroides ovatus]|nr:LruC domain-containing protein [Bacteroides ovatus]
MLRTLSFTIKLSNLIFRMINHQQTECFHFCGRNRNNRKEIHVIGYQSTKLANTDLFGGNNDNSSVSGKKYYLSKEQSRHGNHGVPTDFRGVLEYANIKPFIPCLADWVTSGGVKNQEWWKRFDSSKVYK